MNTIKLSVPEENIQQIADTVKSQLMAELKQQFIPKQPAEYISAEELCKRLSITKPTVHEWRKRGIIQAYKIGARVYYKWDEVEKAMQLQAC